MILIYGTGNNAKSYFRFLGNRNCAFIETDKRMKKFCERDVYGIDEINDIEYSEIHVANMSLETVKELLKRNVPKNKIVLSNRDLLQKYISWNRGILDVRIKIPEFPLMLTAITNMNLEIYGTSTILNFGTPILFSDDYARYATLKLLAREINQNNVEGDIAELGVFKGDFAKYLNIEFPNRRLYLFDTFTGFDEEEMSFDMERGYLTSEWFLDRGNLQDTSEKIVLDKMTNPQKCIICKGRFPETIPMMDIKFAMVSIDCDLYNPILAGLKYFYPRLVKGGYIMLHEYNYAGDNDKIKDNFGGVKKAVEDYEKEIGHIVKVPLFDTGSTLVIGK